MHQHNTPPPHISTCMYGIEACRQTTQSMLQQSPMVECRAWVLLCPLGSVMHCHISVRGALQKHTNTDCWLGVPYMCRLEVNSAHLPGVPPGGVFEWCCPAARSGRLCGPLSLVVGHHPRTPLDVTAMCDVAAINLHGGEGISNGCDAHHTVRLYGEDIHRYVQCRPCACMRTGCALGGWVCVDQCSCVCMWGGYVCAHR